MDFVRGKSEYQSLELINPNKKMIDLYEKGREESYVQDLTT